MTKLSFLLLFGISSAEKHQFKKDSGGSKLDPSPLEGK